MQALVTRPREEAERLAAALAARGISALIEPLFKIVFREGRAPDLSGVQAILCTSANGVRALARASRERDLPLLAVGDATAARARAEGFVRVESAGGALPDLARLAAERLRPEAGRLLHVAGGAVAGDLGALLVRHGFRVDRQVLYDACPSEALSPQAVAALRCGNIDFALFFSPRTARVFVALAEAAGVAEACRRVTALSISAAADAALAPLPWQARAVAERPNRLALLARLDIVLRERQRQDRDGTS
jgi:uroporphyrinogen-III synthase